MTREGDGTAGSGRQGGKATGGWPPSSWQRAALRTALAVRRAFVAPPARDGQVMDRGMAAMAGMTAGSPPPPDVATLRAAYLHAPALVGLRPVGRVSVQDGMAGGRPVRRYAPPNAGRVLLVYFHGGGFIMGGLDSHDALCRTVAAGAGVSVAAVQYRLAPEHPFPAAVEDSAAAFRALRAEWDGPVAVGGDSAGGNLAAGVCQSCRDAAPMLQWLLYPALDMVEDGYRSLALFPDQFPLTREGLELCGRLYLPPDQDPRDPRMSPIRGELAGLPPAVVVAAGFDPLRDQAVAYADALRRAGVSARLLMEAELVHGFADFAGVVPGARRAVWRAVAALRDALRDAGMEARA